MKHTRTSTDTPEAATASPASDRGSSSPSRPLASMVAIGSSADVATAAAAAAQRRDAGDGGAVVLVDQAELPDLGRRHLLAAHEHTRPADAGLLRHDHRRRRLGPHRPRPQRLELQLRRSGQPGRTSRTRSPVPTAFAPATLSTETVNGLMNGGRMDGLTDGVRIRRARNSTGTTWQDVRLYPSNYGSWSWAFGGGIYLNRMCFDGTCSNIASNNTGYGGQSTRTAGLNSGDRRLNTFPQQNHDWQSGFWYGGTVSGAAEQRDQLPVAVHATRASPFRSRRCSSGRRSAKPTSRTRRCPQSGAPATTVRPMLDDRPVDLPWQVTNLNQGQTALRSYVLGFAEYGNTIFVGGKFREVQHGPGGAKVAQSYLAAFDKNTGAFIPSFAPVINGPVHELKTTPDGKLIVAGEFTTVNGAATTGLVALNPTTGATLTGWSATGQPHFGRAGRADARHPGQLDLHRWVLQPGHRRAGCDPAPGRKPGPRPRHGRVPRWQVASEREQQQCGTSMPTPRTTASTWSACSDTLNGAKLPCQAPRDRRHHGGRGRARAPALPAPTPTPSASRRSSRSAMPSTRVARSTSSTSTPRATTRSSAST